MKKAMSETIRRRKIQEEYNTKNNIVPKTIKKKVSGGVIDTLRGTKSSKAAKKTVTKEKLSPEALDRQIEELKKEMKLASRDLRFEDAAKIRDEIRHLSELRMLM
jgi:excinuclease ABC subunit B